MMPRTSRIGIGSGESLQLPQHSVDYFTVAKSTDFEPGVALSDSMSQHWQACHQGVGGSFTAPGIR
jgi:hypothetical protein